MLYVCSVYQFIYIMYLYVECRFIKYVLFNASFNENVRSMNVEHWIFFYTYECVAYRGSPVQY